ncbi:MAG: biotin/lipoyl-binding protein [Clostridia bacterium]|nr:biotin/lipoyl-binding protein [Clostridia bacterium]
MRKFAITVNGKSYEVEVEEINDGSTVTTRPAPQPTAQVVDKNQSNETKKPASKPSASVPTGAQEIKAPMPGNILDVKINNGDSIKKGDVMFILEAMKMENEIMAPEDGTVASVNVSKGATVDTGDVLASLQ